MNHLTAEQYRARRQRALLIHLATEAFFELVGLFFLLALIILGMYAIDRRINPQPPADAPVTIASPASASALGYDLTRRHAR